MKRYAKSIFIFHRDLRLYDNTALREALSQSHEVIPIFIITPEQCGEKNTYKGAPALQFMLNSLKELDLELRKKNSRLFFFYGSTHEVVAKLIQKETIAAVFSNADYTPFAQKRDALIASMCNDTHNSFHVFHDALLHAPGDVVKKDGTPYTIYTPFLKEAQKYPVKKPQKYFFGSLYKKSLSFKSLSFTDVVKKLNSPTLTTLLHHGGRKEGLQLLKQAKQLKNYAVHRNIPALKGTSLLSPHHKFGTISIRETYHTFSQSFGSSHALIKELYWRDFFTHVGYFFPHVFQGSFKKQYDALSWSTSQKKFEAWKRGETGFPLVDAGMRELVTTGYMHNRIRMITASFLVKDLHINWQWGEKFFAQHLADYNPAVNNGNWQWVASTGCDAQPYFRIFNPWLQQKKYDPECLYIKKWIPELKNLTPKEIHQLHKTPKYLNGYPNPIVDHEKVAKETKLLFKRYS